jgi:cytochrome P450
VLRPAGTQARPLLDNMLGRDPPDHGRLRRLVSMAFTPRRIDELRGQIERVCEELLSAAPSGRPFDLVADYALPLPLTVIAGLLGVPPEDRQRFHILVRGSLPLGVPTGSLLDTPRALPSVWQLTHYFRALFAERRLRPRDDLFSALVQAEAGGDRLSADELLGTAMLLVVAGYETTVHVIASGALALLQNPDERVRFADVRDVADSAMCRRALRARVMSRLRLHGWHTAARSVDSPVCLRRAVLQQHERRHRDTIAGRLRVVQVGTSASRLLHLAP